MFGLSVLKNHVIFGRNKVYDSNPNIQPAQTKIKHEALEILINNVPVGLGVRIYSFHPQGPGSTPGLGNFVRIEHLETTLHLDVTKYSIPSAQTTIKHEALEILIDNIPVGLAVRVCGFHPQGPGSTPGLGNFVAI